jgi:hypothetical protein
MTESFEQKFPTQKSPGGVPFSTLQAMLHA